MIPAALVYVGDAVGMDSRQKALADLMAASAVGTALAIAVPALAGVVLACLSRDSAVISRSGANYGPHEALLHHRGQDDHGSACL